MSDLNVTILNGRLTRDAEMRYTPAGNGVCSFSVATNKKYRNKDGEQIEKVVYHNCTMFGKQAEVFKQHTSKGSFVSLMGEYENDNYRNKDGIDVKTMRLIVNQFSFLDKKEGGDYSKAVEQLQHKAPNAVADFSNNDIPF